MKTKVLTLRILKQLLIVLYFILDDVGGNQQVIYQIKGYSNNNVYIKLEPIGCFKDQPSRALRVMYADLRSKIRWSTYPDTSYIVKACAERAYQEAYTGVFGIQFYGECWSDGSAKIRYNKYGASKNCEYGVGRHWANMVYSYEVLPDPPTCNINGKKYNEGDQMIIGRNSTSCDLCTCSGGEARGCKGFICKIDYQTFCLKFKHLPGQCCPVCDCYNNGQTMAVGSTWVARKDSICAECSCQANSVAKCHIKTCKCIGDLVPISVPGQCCPKCVARTTAAPTPETIPPTTERPPPIIPPRPVN